MRKAAPAEGVVRETVELSVRAPRGTSRVQVMGELVDWLRGLELRATEEGAFARDIDLPVGVYQTKLLFDGATWQLDPSLARTRSAGGNVNSLLVVGGAPEPLLFAPAAPWLEPLVDGGVRVLAGVRRSPGAPESLRVRYREASDAPWSEVAARPAFDEDEHAFFVCELPSSSRGLELELHAGAGAPFVCDAPRPIRSPPAWWQDACIYTVFVDRFRPAADRPDWERDPGRGVRAGGHLDGVRRSLGELADLGATALYLTPVHVGASAHRYDLVEPLAVDPELGGEEAYRRLAEAARARGMRIIQDLSFAHAGRGFEPYEDVRALGRASAYAGWFQWREGELAHYGTRTDAPLLDLDHPAVRDLMVRAARRWAELGASGLRLDMAAEVPFELGRAVRDAFLEVARDGIVLGEIVPRHAWRWRAEGVCDASYDFAFHETVTDLVVRSEASLARALDAIAESDLCRGGDARATAARVLSTHDHPRLATLAARAGTEARLVPAYALMVALPGVPMLLYGEEIGLRSMGAEATPEDVWPDRRPMPFVAHERDEGLRASLRALLSARASSPALRRGRLEVLHADASLAVLRRAHEGEVVDVVVCFGAEPLTVSLDDDELPCATSIALSAAARVADVTVSFTGPGYALLRRERALGRSMSTLAAKRNLALVDQELRACEPVGSALPTRLYFSVTERCNLACRHCITRAPERTASGEARTMTPAVLDALRPSLAFAEYFAFVHGGESLTARAFDALLAAIREARGGEPYAAHLLTNGMLFGPAAAARLTGLGVTSVSVSLDGASGRTNDEIRAGGSFERVIANVRDVVRWREGERAPLTLGLSFVVLRQNLHELVRLMELARELGVDWVKLEEGVGATAFAERSLVSMSRPEVRAQVDAAARRGRELGLVVVDHTAPRSVWRCRLDDDTRAFLEADERANGVGLHPCRAPWDSAFIEPNGDVRIGDFHGPVLGNLTLEPMSSVWRSPAAVAERDRSMLERLCGPSGPVVCVD